MPLQHPDRAESQSLISWITALDSSLLPSDFFGIQFQYQKPLTAKATFAVFLMKRESKRKKHMFCTHASLKTMHCKINQLHNSWKYWFFIWLGSFTYTTMVTSVHIWAFGLCSASFSKVNIQNFISFITLCWKVATTSSWGTEKLMELMSCHWGTDGVIKASPLIFNIFCFH